MTATPNPTPPRRLASIPSATVALALSLIATLAVLATPCAAAPSAWPLRRARPDIPLPGPANRFDYASIDAPHRLLFLAHLGAGTVTVVNLKTERVMANVPNLPAVHGVLAVPTLGEVFATATGRNQVAVITEKGLQVSARAPAGRYPDGMAYARSFQQLFISDEHGGTETVVDTLTNRRITTIAMGGHVGNTQYDPLTQQILAAVQTWDQIVAIDPRTDRIVHRYTLPPNCHHDHSLLLDAPASLAFVGCDGNAKLVLLNLKTMQALSLYDVGRRPDVLAFDPGLRRLYVAAESGVVSVFQLHDRALHLLGQKHLADHAHSVAVDPTTHLVYFPLQNVDGRPVLRVMTPLMRPAS